jgi:hypothetical protein
MASRAYLLSLPERVIRAALGFSAGLLREVGEVVRLLDRVRKE